MREGDALRDGDAFREGDVLLGVGSADVSVGEGAAASGTAKVDGDGCPPAAEALPAPPSPSNAPLAVPAIPPITISPAAPAAVHAAARADTVRCRRRGPGPPRLGGLGLLMAMPRPYS
ncbi:hypothetical protein ACN3XK_24190, partial [Actinomadura welshii]